MRPRPRRAGTSTPVIGRELAGRRAPDDEDSDQAAGGGSRRRQPTDGGPSDPEPDLVAVGIPGSLKHIGGTAAVAGAGRPLGAPRLPPGDGGRCPTIPRGPGAEPRRMVARADRPRPRGRDPAGQVHEALAAGGVCRPRLSVIGFGDVEAKVRVLQPLRRACLQAAEHSERRPPSRSSATAAPGYGRTGFNRRRRGPRLEGDMQRRSGRYSDRLRPPAGRHARPDGLPPHPGPPPTARTGSPGRRRRRGTRRGRQARRRRPQAAPPPLAPARTRSPNRHPRSEGADEIRPPASLARRLHSTAVGVVRSRAGHQRRADGA